MNNSNAPQASPTIQELLDEIFNEHTVALTSFTDDHGDTITDMDRVVIDVPKSKQAILTLFSRIITEARPEKKHYGDTCTPTHCFCMYTPRNDAIDQYERNLRAAIEGKQCS